MKRGLVFSQPRFRVNCLARGILGIHASEFRNAAAFQEIPCPELLSRDSGMVASRELSSYTWAKEHGFAVSEIPCPDIHALQLQSILPQLWSVVGIGVEAAEALGDLGAALGDVRDPGRHSALDVPRAPRSLTSSAHPAT